MSNLQDAVVHVFNDLLQLDRSHVASAASAAAAAYVTYNIIDTFLVSPNRSALKLLPGPDEVDSYRE